MCGRFGLTIAWSELYDYFSLIRPTDAGPEMPPRYNIAPTQPIVTIRSGFDGGREALLARWGLVPGWVKDPKSFTTLTNARTETAAEKPSFKAALRHRRVLIPASGFYEWQRFGKGRKSQPYWVCSQQDPIIAFGGLMETWAGEDGSEVDTVCILTTDATESFAPIHHRLPLVIREKDFDRWLDCKTQEPKDIEDLMRPIADDYFTPVPVSDSVNKVANDNPDNLKRVEPQPDQAQKPDDGQMSMF
ncbi:SOS response-associated peptidase [Pseudahrensia aquimaris]|uniref:Abasic site processing protein n=1 Tax=Pseudahrensia aquimaris TaxID=744461 RepID=A0ABW3FH74_9HYPH